MPTARISAALAAVTCSVSAAAASGSAMPDSSSAPGKSVNPLTSLVTSPDSWSVPINSGAPAWPAGTCACRSPATAATCDGVPPSVPSIAPLEPIRMTPPRCSRATRSVPTAFAELAITTVPARSAVLIPATAAAAAVMSVPVTGPPGGTGGTGAGGGSGCGVGGGGELVGSAAGADVAGTLVATMLLGPGADEKADGVPRVDG